MRFHLVLMSAAASLALASAPAVAGDKKSPAAPAAAAAAAAGTKAEKKICRRYEDPASHFSKRHCLTKAQWEQIERDR